MRKREIRAGSEGGGRTGARAIRRRIASSVESSPGDAGASLLLSAHTALPSYAEQTRPASFRSKIDAAPLHNARRARLPR